MQAEDIKRDTAVTINDKIIIVSGDDSGISSAASTDTSNNSVKEDSEITTSKKAKMGGGKDINSVPYCIIEFQALNNRTESTFVRNRAAPNALDISTIHGQRTLDGTVNSEG